MDYKTIILQDLNERIEVETNSSKKEELIKLKKVLEQETLYKGALYSYVYLRPQDYTHLDMYNIPEIHQAFIDVIKNPSLPDINPDQTIDITYPFSRYIPREILLDDKELMDLIPNLTFEQAQKLFCGPETKSLLNEKRIYDIIIAKAKEDNRFYSVMDYNTFAIEDNILEYICEQDQGGNKLSKVSADIQLKVIVSIKGPVKLEQFLRNISTYEPSVQEAIINSSILTEQLIIIQSEDLHSNSIIPKEYESDIVAKYLNFIKELSYEQKFNFIYKMRDPEMQKYLMKTLNFAKNLISHTDAYSFYEGIKDDNYLVETLCDLEILQSIGRYHFQYVIPKLSLEIQRKIYQNPVFQEYIRKHAYYRDIVPIMANFDEEIIDEFLPLLKNIEVYDYLTLFTETKNSKYIPKIIEELEKLKETKYEDFLITIKYISNTLINKDHAALLTEEEFNYFNNYSTKVTNLEEALSYIEKSYLPDPMHEKDLEILKIMNKDKVETPEEKNALTAYRLNKHHEDTLNESLKQIRETKERTIKKIGYEIINRASKEDRQVLLDRMTIEGLITHLPSSKHFIDYIYELYTKNPNIFDNIKFSKEDRVKHSDENLEEESLQKLIKLFFLVPKQIQEEMLNSNFVMHEEIKEYVRKKALNDPNYFNGNVYDKIIKAFTPEELRTILESLSLNNIISFYSTNYFSMTFTGEDKIETVRNEVLLKRKDEIIHEININTRNAYYNFSTGTILHSLYKIVPDKKEFLSSLNPTLLIDTYTQHPFSEDDKQKNKYIIDILKNTPDVLTQAKEDRVKRVLTTLPKKDLEYLLENFTVSHIIILLSKTKNKDTEETLMTKFKENPYFINQTEQSLEEILSRLEEDNKTIIYNTIDEQFNSLELPYNIKQKLKKLSYDEKIFLIYGVKENIFNDEKYELIVELLNKDPFALNSLNIELFRDNIFKVSKNIIPKIYRYETLTIDYINLIKVNNIRSKILLKLIEHMNKYTTNEIIYAQKLEAIIGYLTERLDLTIDRYNLNNVTEEELGALEEYILADSIDYLIETSIFHAYNYFTDRENKGNNKTAIEIEKKRIIDLDLEMDTETDFNKAKDIYFKKYFKINTEQAKKVLQKYQTSLNEISKYIENQEVLQILTDINKALNITSLDELKELYYSDHHYYKIEDFLYMFEELNKSYNKSIANDIKGYKNGKEKPFSVVVDDETVIVNAIELETDFDMFVHSTDAYGSMEMINDNYFDSWNYSDKTNNHGICTSYISNSNLGTAKVKGKGVMFGFVKLNQNSISLMAPYDLVSHNDTVITTSRRPPMYTNLKELGNYTRHTHNEAVLERRNVTDDSKYPVIQPDCIIIFEEMSDEIKANSIRAQRDFKERGVDLPIIYINKHKVIELEARKLSEMINIYEKQPNLELLAEIINKYESNRCGLDFEENLNVEEIFHKDKIIELITSTLRQVKEVANKDDIIKFINVLEHEIYKFALIEETVEKRAHTFDLLNDNLKIELDILKKKYLQNSSSVDSNYSL